MRKLGMIRQMTTGLFVRHCLVRKDLKSRSGTATDKLIWFTHEKRVPGRMTWQKKAGAPGCGGSTLVRCVGFTSISKDKSVEVDG